MQEENGETNSEEEEAQANRERDMAEPVPPQTKAANKTKGGPKPGKSQGAQSSTGAQTMSEKDQQNMLQLVASLKVPNGREAPTKKQKTEASQEDAAMGESDDQL